MTLYFDQQPCHSITRAIGRYAKDEFNSVYRSTVPLLSFLDRENVQFDSLLKRIDMLPYDSLHLEYKVPPQKGCGKGSQTDVMVISGQSSLAIEAKWTEPRYETVGKWLGNGSNAGNKEQVLEGWLYLLNTRSNRILTRNDIQTAVYQMVHRAASACFTGKFPRMIYLVFEPSYCVNTAGKDVIKRDLESLHNLLGRPETFPFYLVTIFLTLTTNFKELASPKCKGKSTRTRLKTALLTGAHLFDFENYQVTRI